MWLWGPLGLMSSAGGTTSELQTRLIASSKHWAGVPRQASGCFGVPCKVLWVAGVPHETHKDVLGSLLGMEGTGVPRKSCKGFGILCEACRRFGISMKCAGDWGPLNSMQGAEISLRLVGGLGFATKACRGLGVLPQACRGLRSLLRHTRGFWGLVSGVQGLVTVVWSHV